MSSIPLMHGITSQMVVTPRLTQHVRFSGSEEGVPVLFVHGNASSATFWEEVMLGMPYGYRGIAPDLRGFGDTEDKLIDATRGVTDWSDDLLALMDTLDYPRFHVVGHSLGGSVLWRLIGAAPERVVSATVVCPGSPFGYGGTKGLDGAPCNPDFAGSGGGIVNPEFARLIGTGDRTTDNPQASPRVVMNTFYWKPTFRPAREEELLSGVLSEKVGQDRYPGDFAASEYWPGAAPGIYGPSNALSPKYVGDAVERLLAAESKPPILWVRGADDQIVADGSLFDIGTLGALGAVPGWPGADTYPAQPMVSQTRHVLEQYAEQGGTYHEEVLAECGHTPFLEQHELFMQVFNAHLKGTNV